MPLEPTEDELADLAALADGSLPPQRRAAVEARVAASPLLQALLAQQREVVRATRTLADAAPPGLRAHVAAAAQRTRRRARRRIGAFATAGVAAAAAAAAAAIVIGGSGGGAGNRVSPEQPLLAAVRLATRPPTLPAPAPYRDDPAVLRLEVQDLPYPNWQRKFGWRAIGARKDRVGRRRATTLFYARDGQRVAYTILSRPALSAPRDAPMTLRDGVKLRTSTLAGRVVVTWRRRGHTCVLSGERVSRATLLALGAWRAGGAIPY